ncbi:MAG: hypothetical protein JWL96_16 [Sphingomonas bacterium]|uniref:hypothetical protein n=1 Tax=Sphingomonas bacterium TaxID=1895847 RepID=UPI002614DA47|nr:hypothetical protein [Sphingomonas bacterium]MDB5707946.1 hypothetical protein [Sphingomonas bacterium]
MKATTQRTLRQYHHYIGVFLAPAILFFAISGAFQTFRLTEEKGWGSTPPSWLVWVAAVHKDQAPPHENPVGPKPAAAADHHDGDDADHHDADHHDDAAPAAEAPQPAKGPSPLPLKIFVVLMAIGLITSTLLGVTIALNNRATRRVSILMLVAGAVLPCVLLWL